MKKNKTQKVQKQEIEEKIPENLIECDFKQIKRSSFTDSEETKSGLYSNSSYPLPGFGVTKWVICAYIEVPYDRLVSEGKTHNQIIEGCVNHLNVRGMRKTKKGTKYQYGKLEPIISKITGEFVGKLKPETNTVIVELLTDDPRNQYFWGDAQKF